MFALALVLVSCLAGTRSLAADAGIADATQARSADGEEPARSSVEEAADEDPEDRLSSTEQGHVQMGQSFPPPEAPDGAVAQRRQALRETDFDWQLRSFGLERDNFDGSEDAAWAIGGHAGFKTGYLRERLAFGATGYTSQRLYGPLDKDGTGLLRAGQRSYSVLGETYAELRVADGLALSAGRRGYDSPYINRDDSRMVPNTFEALALQGAAGGDDGSGQWRFGAAYIDAIKPRTSLDFISMAQAAGAPVGVERGVYAGGLLYAGGAFTAGAVDYYCDDIINIAYGELTWSTPLARTLQLTLAAQHTDQRSTGGELLAGDAFSASQSGIKADLAIGKSALLTVAHVRTGDGADIRSPWGGFPGYNSVQLRDFYRAGEDSWMLRAAWELPRIEGLSLYALVVDGSQPEDPSQFAQTEYDFNLQWAPTSGSLRGLSLRARYAHVTQDGGQPDADELRLILQYGPVPD